MTPSLLRPLPPRILLPVILSLVSPLALPLRAQEASPAATVVAEQGRLASVRGADIATVLGTQLEAVARAHGLTGDELDAIARRDPGLHADTRGHLHYACDGPAPQLLLAATQAAQVEGMALSATEVFQLHSRPGARRVIYLDFDGHTTRGTYWNSGYSSGADIVTPPYDIDGDPSFFSATELARIQGVWRRVSEDFAPVEVDVTTQDPGVEALRRSGSSDSDYGVRVCIGGSSLAWRGVSAGGVAYIGSFNWSSDTPCFVFTAQLGNGHEKYTAEAASHEIGHTLGLAHDGATSGCGSSGNDPCAYYSGHGNWAPIMGTGYSRAVTHWSRGEYPLADQKQDDLQIMQSTGAPLRSDDHGNTTADATLLAPATSLQARGIIERTSDVDVFRILSGSGLLTVKIDVSQPAPNLDVQATLVDSLGQTLAVTNSAALGVTLTAQVPAGTLYLKVDGVGSGTLATGYSDYASLGEYVISGSVPGLPARPSRPANLVVRR